MAEYQYNLPFDEILPGHKKCSKCKGVKPYSCFDFNNITKDGYRFECKDCRRHYRQINSVILTQKQSIYYTNHADEYRRWRRDHRERNVDIIRMTEGQRYRENPQRIKAQNDRRKARLQELPNTLTQRDKEFVLQYWDNTCAICGCNDEIICDLRFDHWISIHHPHCPGTVPGNIILLCNTKKETPIYQAGCDQSKGNKDGAVWLRERFGQKEGQRKLREIKQFLDAARKYAAETGS